ncbi:NAD(+)--rifampin ADP-ribosyltransferase [Cellulomonas composti]|uniref:Rifampin ADP-ribosyl transferase n=1 Tax=Cellulomonas composti TaxID=266130 RepID=A0A511JA11_9CELL|nr:NAD(+)--rifampin ADP-ribosyltransferase [Cellulomonas composti]GEL94825.1 rifampin ADP-ribosyl transferase [Cellulomonas composti]
MAEEPSTVRVDDPGPFFHGTKADLRPGDLLEPGRSSNYGSGRAAKFVYLTATTDAAVWGAELAAGTGPGRVYRVEPLGEIENDPNLTDKRFEGNPTRSYRTLSPVRVLGEVTWQAHPPEVLQTMLDHLRRLADEGVEAIED